MLAFSCAAFWMTLRRFVHFVKRQAGAAADVDEDALRALNGIVFQQRAGDGAIGGIDGAVGAGGDGGAHHRVALAGHDGFHVGKIAIDDAGHGDDVGNSLHSLAQNVVGDAEGVEKAGAALDGFHQALVGNDDDGVDGADQFLQSLFGLQHAALAFKREGLGDHGDAQRAEFAGERSYHRRSAAAGASAEAGSDENHVRAFQRFDDFLGVFQRGFAADFGIGARAKTFGQFRAQLQFHRSLRKLQRLQVGVGGDEFHAFHLGADHAIDGVAPAATHANYFDFRRLQLLAEAHPDSTFFYRHTVPSTVPHRSPRSVRAGSRSSGEHGFQFRN